MGWIEWITFGIALIGATLGVFNAWWSVRRDAVRLRVRLVTLMTVPAGEFTVGVEVTNMGYIPVTVTEVAVYKPGSKKRMVINGDYFQRVALPTRMEPRTSITVAADPSMQAELRRVRARWCSASTACGVTKRSRFKLR